MEERAARILERLKSKSPEERLAELQEAAKRLRDAGFQPGGERLIVGSAAPPEDAFTTWLGSDVHFSLNVEATGTTFRRDTPGSGTDHWLVDCDGSDAPEALAA